MWSDRAGRIGVLFAAAGATSYGVTVVVGRDLAEAGFGPATSLGARFLTAGALLAVVLRVRRVPLAGARRDVVTGLGLGLLYAIESTFFFSALERGTASATALVFYVYPAMVTVVELLRRREHAQWTMLAALGMSVGGTALVVSAGGHLSTTAAGVAFSLAAAATFSVYLLAGRDIGRASDPMVMACWVSFGAAAGNLARGAITQELVNPSSHAFEMVLYGGATAAAFTLTFAAMQRIGATKVAVVMTLDAVSTVVLAALFLGERVTAVQALGGAAVLAAAVVIARTQPVEVATAETSAPAAGT